MLADADTHDVAELVRRAAEPLPDIDEPALALPSIASPMRAWSA